MNPLRILHTSDLHGGYHAVLDAPDDWDLWVDTGDFFPTFGRRPQTGYRIVPDAERVYQRRWVQHKRLGPRLVEKLRGRPLVCVAGNHDYLDLGVLVHHASGMSFTIGHGRQHAVVLGVTFAGFREIPWSDGEWNGETHDLHDRVQRVLDVAPDVLLTHAPPGGILDTDAHGSWGIPALTSALQYADTAPRLHLFGHVHAHGGREETHGRTRFVNGATCARVIELLLPETP